MELERSPSPAVPIVAYLRGNITRTRDSTRIGPFVVIFDRDSANPYRNYALPDDFAEPTPQDMAALIAAFATRERLSRLEYVPDLAPAVWPALARAGFKREGELPLMVCSGTTLRFPVAPDGVTLSLINDDSDLEAAARVQNEAYRGPQTSGADIARLRSLVDRRGAVALARDSASGEAVGAGLHTPPLNDMTEVAAIGVRATFRRRGIGAALAALLALNALTRAHSRPFLMAARDEEARLYGRVGFAACATMLHTSCPSPSVATGGP